MIIKNLERIESRDTAIIAITENGKKLAFNLKKIFPRSTVFCSGNNLNFIFKEVFSNFKNVIAIMATGIVIRKIAPLIKSKSIDPAVVVMDELGHFAISLISGHLGGANELVRYVSSHINSVPVITTATDVNNKFAIDTIPLKTGWVIENTEKIKLINSGVLENRKIVINISREFLKFCFPEYNEKIFYNFVFVKNERDVINSEIKLKVLITNSLIVIPDNTLIIRPKNLYLGIGCNRGTSFEELEKVVLETLKQLNRSYKSINSISSFELKSDEPAILKFGEKYNVKLVFYKKEELNSVEECYEPSEYLIKNIGVKGVCEPSAILSAKQDMMKCLKRKTLITKQKSGNVTIAIQELNFV